MPDHSTPFAVVTGGNRGIGREVCKQLAQAGYRVLLTCRSPDEGRDEAAQITAEVAQTGGAEVQCHSLDVTDQHSIDALAGHLTSIKQPIDALVNNAGVALDGFDAEVVRRTLAVNYYGPARVTDALMPLLTPQARIVMVSSGIGELAGMPAILRARFEDETLTRAALDALVEDFQTAVAEGRHQAAGWPSSAYRVSKVALNAFTRILGRELEASDKHVLAICPGWVRTSMGGSSAPRPVREGARGVVWAATLPSDGPGRGFFRDSAPIPW